jgi:chondroitin 4-sulfotransferase 11
LLLKYIVSEDHAFVYFVVQKVATTSIKTAIAPLFETGVHGEGGGAGKIHKLFPELGYQIDKDDLFASMDKYEEYFKFAFVRNPWSRLVSCYSDKFVGEARGLRAFRGGPMIPKGLTFAEFVDIVSDIPDEKANLHFASQYRTLCGPDGELIPDFVGRFENLVEDFRHVAERIGDPVLKLPHIHRSGSNSYREYYDRELESRVRERYIRDIELFGYSF